MMSNKKQILVFLFLTFFFSGLIQLKFVIDGDFTKNAGLVFLLMWTPGLSGLLCSWVFDRSFKPIGFKKPSLKELGISYAFPFLAATLVFFLLLLFKINTFGINGPVFEQVKSYPKFLIIMLLVAPTFGVLSGFLYGIGEEIGWRGFLHTKFIEEGVSYPYIKIGAIWALWHFPLIFLAGYSTSENKILSAFLFSIMVVTLSVFMGKQRERTGSVWLAGLTHSAHNTWIQAIYPGFLIAGPLNQYFGGEFGVFLALTYVVFILVLYRKNFKEAFFK